MTTIDTITDSMIEELRTESGQVGDLAQVVICDYALGRGGEYRGDNIDLDSVAEEVWDSWDSNPAEPLLPAEATKLARAECARVIADAEAQDTDGLHEGDRVEGGDEGTEDHDTGRVTEVDGDQITVAWDSLVQTTQAASLLRRAG